MRMSATAFASFQTLARSGALVLVLMTVLAGFRVEAADIVEAEVSYSGYDMDFMRSVYQGDWRDRQNTLKGKLYLPAAGGRHPVVILQHGSAAPDHSSYRAWKERLRAALLEKGIGVFLADSYSGRDISDTARNQGQLSRASRVVDALMALDALAKRPDVNPGKIGITGFSFGGTVSNLTANEEFVAHVLPGGPRFAAHVPIYAGCGSKFAQHKATGAPVLMLLAADDDYTSPASCLDSAEDMRNNGAQVEVVQYEGARHGFVSSDAVDWYDSVWQFDQCPRQIIGNDGEEQAGDLSSGGKSWTEFVRALARSCAKKGVHMGADATAAEDALNRTVAFFARHLGS